ncbi:MAG TPA: hypothetical protein DCE41_21085, partial [Cytophagales bacterium]|nr:hypothetical protein [Cytophagales bacterium]HAP61757.1 hypothetical protein [Cytophagales bacterium]
KFNWLVVLKQALIDISPEVALEAFQALLRGRKNPKMTVAEVLERFRRAGLQKAIDYLHTLW